ncbi:MAG: sigma-70 family RNA polymerase sigma factor, partial [Planctomycetota bacterium]|nr:sigma-70 family RNA polymerase sigma factor [Planctomycetota bacterium]
GGDDADLQLDEVPGRADELSSEFDLEYRREVFRWAAEQVRNSVAETTWQAFHLTHIQGVSITDTARQLGLSTGSVYVARGRIMNRLRELAKQFEEQA